MTQMAMERVVETLDDLNQHDGGIAELFVGLDFSLPAMREAGLTDFVAILTALRSVAEAVLAGDERMASAQRRLLEALGAMVGSNTLGLSKLLFSLEAGVHQMRQIDPNPEVPAIFEALGELAVAVRADGATRKAGA